MLREFSLFVALMIALFLVVPAHAGLLFFSTMDSAAEIETPAVYQELYAPVGDAIPGPGNVSYVTGRFGNAVQIENSNGPVDGPIRFKDANFDFDDPAQDGGRLDVWLRFDQDPHTALNNTWILRTNWPTRRINFEMTGGDPMLDVYAEVAHNERTNYYKFRVSPRNHPAWENLSAGEWHLFTFLWRHNGGLHKDEIHYFIDGQLIRSDFNGNLPIQEQLTDLLFCPRLNGDEIDMSFDEIYSFDSWDVSGINGNFADLQIPEGVTLTYPMDGRYPQWGEPVSDTNQLTFAFYTVDTVKESCDCDVYVDDNLAGSVTATERAYTEFYHATPLSNGTHTFQVKCDGDRLVSPVHQFNVDFTGTPIKPKSFSSLKQIFKRF